VDGTRPPPGDEYAPLELRGGLLLSSYLCFAAALSSRFLVPLIPAPWRPIWRPLMAGLMTPALALVGILLGLAALRWGGAPGFARLAVALNGLVLTLSLLLIAAFFWILPAEYRPF
jgi:hypothetical protein